jgi:hypothetical protein
MAKPPLVDTRVSVVMTKGEQRALVASARRHRSTVSARARALIAEGLRQERLERAQSASDRLSAPPEALSG